MEADAICRVQGWTQRARGLCVSLGVVAIVVNVVTAAEHGTAARIRAQLDGIPAIDTHSHLHTWAMLEAGRDALFYSLWRVAYTNQVIDFARRQPGESASAWWARSEPMIANARATGFYRYKLAAFLDLYGVDFENASTGDIDAVPQRVADNYRDRRWLYEVITQRANIDVMITDPYWAKLDFVPEYPFEAHVLHVSSLLSGFHRSEFATAPTEDPYAFAVRHNITVASLADYVALLDRMMGIAKAKGAVGLKSTRAYQRTLQFAKIPAEKAASVFGRPRVSLTPEEVRDFEDFIMWQIVELAAKHDLPFQIHTGHGRLQGSNPLLLLDLIEANPQTKFVLFHGGYPWVGETAAIGLRHWRHVWIDMVWLPTISTTTARRALHEWLEVVPSDRLLWGSDCFNAETIYAATNVTRAVIAEVLAEKVQRAELREADALRIGRQILRENALALYPALEGKLSRNR